MFTYWLLNSDAFEQPVADAGGALGVVCAVTGLGGEAGAPNTVGSGPGDGARSEDRGAAAVVATCVGATGVGRDVLLGAGSRGALTQTVGSGPGDGAAADGPGASRTGTGAVVLAGVVSRGALAQTVGSGPGDGGRAVVCAARTAGAGAEGRAGAGATVVGAAGRTGFADLRGLGVTGTAAAAVCVLAAAEALGLGWALGGRVICSTPAVRGADGVVFVPGGRDGLYPHTTLRLRVTRGTQVTFPSTPARM